MKSNPIEAEQVSIMQDLMKLSRMVKVVNTTKKITVKMIIKTAKDVKSTGQILARM